MNLITNYTETFFFLQRKERKDVYFEKGLQKDHFNGSIFFQIVIFKLFYILVKFCCATGNCGAVSDFLYFLLQC